MDYAWILFVIAAWAIGIFLVLVLMQFAGDQEDKAIQRERGMTLEGGTAADGGPERAGERD